MADGELPGTDKYRFRFCRTAQLPHGWDAGLLFEETTRSLLCSDLLHQNGNCTAVVEDDVIERCRQSMLEYQMGVTRGLRAVLAPDRPEHAQARSA